MDLQALQTFVVVAEERHFGRAADRLGLAQPVVSQHVKRLERQLGADLLTRTTRAVDLTEAGRHLLVRGRSILHEVERTQAEVELVRTGGAGRVVLGFVGTATYDVLPRVARGLREELPAVDLEVHGEQLSPDLLRSVQERRIDLAVVRNADSVAGVEGLDQVHLRTEPLIAVLPAEQAPKARSVKLADLRGETFVTHPSGNPSGYRSVMFETVLHACRQAGFTPREVIEVGETSTLVAFVAAGLGVALVPESVRSLGLDGVAYRALRDVTVRTELALVSRAGDLSPAARAVHDQITAMIAN